MSRITITTWICDQCGYRHESDVKPTDWKQLRVVLHDSPYGVNQILGVRDYEFCSPICVQDWMEKYSYCKGLKELGE